MDPGGISHARCRLFPKFSAIRFTEYIKASERGLHLNAQTPPLLNFVLRSNMTGTPGSYTNSIEFSRFFVRQFGYRFSVVSEYILSIEFSSTALFQAQWGLSRCVISAYRMLGNFSLLRTIGPTSLSILHIKWSYPLFRFSKSISCPQVVIFESRLPHFGIFKIGKSQRSAVGCPRVPSRSSRYSIANIPSCIFGRNMHDSKDYPHQNWPIAEI